MTVEQVPTPGADAERTVACPRCGASAEPGQLLCVECGERISLVYRRPPTWRLPAAVAGGVVLLAGAALALALASITDDADQAASAPPPTGAVTTTQPAAVPPTQTAPVPLKGEQPAEEPPAPAGEQSGKVESWPGDTSAYTVILMSADDRAAAQGRAQDAVEAGIPAGLLRSDDYSSLNPGYWVVFGGRFDSSEEAQQEAERYASLGFPGGYPRFVNGGG